MHILGPPDSQLAWEKRAPDTPRSLLRRVSILQKLRLVFAAFLRPPEPLPRLSPLPGAFPEVSSS